MWLVYSRTPILPCASKTSQCSPAGSIFWWGRREVPLAARWRRYMIVWESSLHRFHQKCRILCSSLMAFSTRWFWGLFIWMKFHGIVRFQTDHSIYSWEGRLCQKKSWLSFALSWYSSRSIPLFEWKESKSQESGILSPKGIWRSFPWPTHTAKKASLCEELCSLSSRLHLGWSLGWWAGFSLRPYWVGRRDSILFHFSSGCCMSKTEMAIFALSFPPQSKAILLSWIPIFGD